MTDLPVTMACGPYDRLQALKEGVIKPEGIDLRYVEIQSPPEIFARMLKTNSFDVAEMSSAHYFTMKSRGDFPYVALPVFPSRLFRHGFIFINRNSGISKPTDLAGKRIAVQEYRQSAGVWIRGILKSEYGVDFSGVTWLEGGVDTPRRFDETMDLRPAGDLNLELIGPEKSISDVLASGEVDAYFGARAPGAFFESEDVIRLFPDYRSEERAYFERTGIYPIMHTIIMTEEFHETHSWATEALFKALLDSRNGRSNKCAFPVRSGTCCPGCSPISTRWTNYSAEIHVPMALSPTARRWKRPSATSWIRDLSIGRWMSTSCSRPLLAGRSNPDMTGS